MFYTYYSYEEFGRGYIGKRKCPEGLTPEQDSKYFGSFKDKTFKPTNKIILKVYENEAEALKDEILLHRAYNVDKNPHFANKAKQTSVGFTTCNRIPWNKGKKGCIVGWNKGKKLPSLSQSHKDKISKSLLGRQFSDESKEKIRNKLKNKPKSDQHKQALKDAKNKKYFDWINQTTGEILYNKSIPDLLGLYPDVFIVKSCLYAVANKKKPQYKNWYLYDNQQPDALSLSGSTTSEH